MQHCIYLVTLLAVSLAASTATATGYYYPVPAQSSSGVRSNFVTTLDSPIQQQYHTQDDFGQYSYGYKEPLSRKQETRTLDGTIRGSYSYLDGAGEIQTVHYKADADGFHVLAATNLPHEVVETNEVAAARAQHLAAKQQQQKPQYQEEFKLLKSSAVGVDSNLLTLEAANKKHSYDLLPQPVQDTPEVAAAKREFFQRYAEEQRRHQLLHEREAAAAILRKSSQPTIALTSLPAYQRDSINKDFIYNLVIPVAPQRGYLPVA